MGKSYYTAIPRSAAGAVGLKNLGAICYMNASVQNLFMVPSFRHGILNADAQIPEAEREDSIVHQMQ